MKKNPKPSAAENLDWRQAMADRCHDLNLLAELLIACGEPLEPGVVENIGYAIDRDVAAMKKLLNQLGER